MRCFKSLWNIFTWWPGVCALTAALSWITVASADRFPPDPVTALRQALRAVPEDAVSHYPQLQERVTNAKTDEERRKLQAEARERYLTERAAAVRSIPDMRRALLLTDWRSLEADTLDSLGSGDRAARDRLYARFKEAVNQVLKHGSTDARLAVMHLLADTATTTQAPEEQRTAKERALSPTEKRTLGRDFTTPLIDLAKTGEPRVVRETAARTLGQLFADPKESAAVLGGLLASKDVGQRRAAAAGLLGLIRVPYQLSTGGNKLGTARVEATRADLGNAGRWVVPAAGPGLADPDLEVRRLCTEAIQQAAAALASVMPPLPRSDDAPDAKQNAVDFQSLRQDLLPLMQALGEKAPDLARVLNDRDSQIRLLARRTLEDLGHARERYQRAAAGAGNAPKEAPPAAPGSEEADQGTALVRPTRLAAQQPPAAAATDPLGKGLESALPALAAGLSDPLVEVRLRTLDVLESLGSAAAPAVPALTKALSDRDGFVRWAAARTIGRIGAVDTDLTVPALAHLLRDNDLDVDLAAALALERIGPPAKAAIPELIHCLASTDAEKRTAAIRALEGIGTDAQRAIPALAAAMRDSDPRVRQLAAEALGKFGNRADEAVPALRRAMELDTNPEVRRAAGDALLKILRVDK